jgi:aerobic-type carbon monoxide dehydrogenase small subunit (CoxS/CutS family)
MTERPLRLTVNGEEREGACEPRRLLADFLRENLGLTGTHLGCEHGVCGACTVLLDGEPVRSCLMFAVQAAGHDILTVEGVAPPDGLHPLQEAFWESHSFQCGFCTPGVVMSALAFLRDVSDPTEADVRQALSGNLCRCTGYQSIVDGILLAASRQTGATQP